MRLLLLDHPDGALAPLAGAIAKARPAWHVATESDAALAGTRARAEPWDALLADLGPDGGPALALAGAMQQAHPEAVRVLAARAHDEAATQRGLALAHRVLAHPLTAAQAIEAIERALALREQVASDAVQRMIGGLDKLPPAPRLYLELTRLLDDPRSDAIQIGKVVAQDPALTAKVLQLCNSALYCGSRPVSDVRNAVTRLGWRTISNLALAAEVYAGADALVVEAAQRRALLASLLAQRIVVQPAEADAAATAALLADVGLLLPGLADDHEALAPGSDAVPLHAAAGAFLLGLWGLPAAVAEAVALHHAPARAGERFGIVGGVHVALALVLGHALDERWLARVGVASKLERWRAQHQQLLDAAP